MLYKFGENLKSLRTKKGLSQTQLATKLWLNKSIISAYDLYEKYRTLANEQSRVIFGGRLAEYRYYDMHQVIESALNRVAGL